MKEYWRYGNTSKLRQSYPYYLPYRYTNEYKTYTKISEIHYMFNYQINATINFFTMVKKLIASHPQFFEWFNLYNYQKYIFFENVTFFDCAVFYCWKRSKKEKLRTWRSRQSNSLQNDVSRLSVYGLVLWGWGKAFYSSRPGSAWDFTHVRLIFMNDSFIKCASSILKKCFNYWRKWINWSAAQRSTLRPGGGFWTLFKFTYLFVYILT